MTKLARYQGADEQRNSPTVPRLATLGANAHQRKSRRFVFLRSRTASTVTKRLRCNAHILGTDPTPKDARIQLMAPIHETTHSAVTSEQPGFMASVEALTDAVLRAYGITALQNSCPAEA